MRSAAAMVGCGSSSPLLLLCVLVLYALLAAAPSAHAGSSDREALEISIGPGIGIGIGGGGGGGGGGGSSYKPSPSPPYSCPPPPSPKTLLPSDFENHLLYEAYFVIQRFKKTITCDPKNKTATWTGTKICNNKGDGYAGIYCERPPGYNIRAVASVDFNGFHLCAPTVSGFVDKLPQLALYHANSNKIKGTVPCLSQLPFFYELDVSNQNLAGMFPPTVLPLVNLTFLDVRFNTFSGPLPPEVFNIKTEVLFLNNNRFIQGIPANLGQTTANYITFANNYFTGEIPKSIGKLSNTLIEVLFLNNQLSGCLPSEIGRLKNATVFDAGLNKLTGPIPASFGCLHKVEQLNLASNMLYGEVPDVVCKLGFHGNLLNLSLSGNFFTSLGPSCYPLLACKKLDVRNNCIPGLPGQRSPADCANFAKQPKKCPCSTDMPCQPPKGKYLLESSETPLDHLKEVTQTPSRYTTYTALGDSRRP